ncbi:protein containing HEAT repeats [Hahella chejuensis KCTC 2396]|uniref:Protein containing HEAT repeats n=1 Tax=Hahella chejuensis (strain KCTC 2396) TaxID=349521 RepID=Q2SHK2_HAHCH|nr:HEAT repeat domain-containing protein [Hahella chejuensis]ABC29872.1 protein containing HEAT repeats [Hahella chejuensis KCTC 2396]
MQRQDATEQTRLIEKAQTLLQQGALEDARELLLREGFEQGDNPLLQNAYYELIPLGETLQARLDPLKTALQPPYDEASVKAVAAIVKEAAKASNKVTHAWIRDPRVTDLLIDALSHGNARLVKEAALALTHIVHRYFADYRVRAAFVPLLSNANKTLRRVACGVVGRWPDESIVAMLAPLTEDKAAEVRQEATKTLAGLEQENIPALTRPLFEDALIARLKDSEPTVRDIAAFGLGAHGVARAASELEAALRVEVSPLVRESIEITLGKLTKKTGQA